MALGDTHLMKIIRMRSVPVYARFVISDAVKIIKNNYSDNWHGICKLL